MREMRSYDAEDLTGEEGLGIRVPVPVVKLGGTQDKHSPGHDDTKVTDAEQTMI